MRLTTPAACLASVLLLCAVCRADDAPRPLFAPEWPPSGEAVTERPPAPAVVDPDSWMTLDRPPRAVRSATAGDWGSLTANSVLGDAASSPTREEPPQPSAWKTDGAWRCDVAGPLFVYGQFGGGGTEVAQQDTKVGGCTGLGCKWTPLDETEFTFRSGPCVTYTDPLRPDKLRERSEWLLEVQAHWPILGKIGLEYQGTAAPALTPLDHDWFDQDLGLAAPICTGGKLRVGARRHWENTPDPKPSSDSMQLYFGLELAR